MKTGLNLFLASLSVRWKIIDRDANASEVFPYFAPLKGLRILESDEVLLVESGFPEFFSCGFRNPGLWNPEYSSRDPESTNDWNPESKLYRPIIRNQGPIMSRRFCGPVYFILDTFNLRAFFPAKIETPPCLRAHSRGSIRYQKGKLNVIKRLKISFLDL